MRKLLALILAMALAFSFAACDRSAFAQSESDISVNIGDLITFGDILWRVLDIQDGKALILSEYVLFSQAYHSAGGRITWEHSSLRHYLNNEFLGNTFSPEERERIVETAVVNANSPFYGTAGGNNTTDKIFLLSFEEVRQYFERIIRSVNGSASWWWLRSPGHTSLSAATFSCDGFVNAIGIHASHDNGVRPALRLNLES